MNVLGSAKKCQYCGNFHSTKCPTVKAISYHPDGTIARVEFYSPNDYPPIGRAPQGEYKIS